jgi:hypothetical protein
MEKEMEKEKNIDIVILYFKMRNIYLKKKEKKEKNI